MTAHRAALAPREFFVSARRSIRSWTWHGTYLEACALVMGYGEGLGREAFMEAFSAWLAERYGVEDSNVAFWHHIAQIAVPDPAEASPLAYTPQQNAAAVDKLFELLIAYLDAREPPGA